MAYPESPVAGVTYTTNKTADTFAREVDQKLWVAMQAKSPILYMLERPKVGNRKFEWEIDSQPPRRYTLAAGGANTIVGSAQDADTKMTLTSVTGLEVGALLKNITRATTVGSYGQDETLEVTAIDALVVTVDRDAGGQATANANSAVHTAGDIMEVIYTPKPEGSGPDANKYTDVTLDYNYTNTVDFFLTVTGDQLETQRLVGGDTIKNQFDKNLLNLSNQLESMLFYGVQQAQAAVTAGSNIMRTKGLDNFIGVAGGNTDFTTKDVTPAALDGLLAEIIYDKSDPADKYIIATHPANARKVSTFGADKVRLGQEENRFGRFVDTFMSDLGVQVPIIWSLNVSRSDLFILDMDKISMPMFRMFEKAEWSYGDDGVDAWRQRYMGSLGVKCVDALYSHAKLGLISW
jgi:hypothetical protein